jgi:hypothetical protein
VRLARSHETKMDSREENSTIPKYEWLRVYVRRQIGSMEYLTSSAHAAALNQAGVSPFSVYHPGVIQQYPDHFNDNWRAYWEIR